MLSTDLNVDSRQRRIMAQKITDVQVSNIRVDRPVRNASGTSMFAEVWYGGADGTLVPLRFQLTADTSMNFAEASVAVFGASSSAHYAGGANAVTVEIAIANPIVVSKLRQIQAHLVDALESQHRARWLPESAAARDLKDYYRDCITTKCVDGEASECMTLTLRPWKTFHPTRCFEAATDGSRVTPCEVTRIDARSRLIPVLHIAGVTVSPDRLRLSVHTTEVLIRRVDSGSH